MKFELEDSLRGVSDEELLEDLGRCAKIASRGTVTMAEYDTIGKAHSCTIQRRFGAWSIAIKLAGLEASGPGRDATDQELFENIKTLWISLGRQPRMREVQPPDSQFGVKRYIRRFGSWSRALRAFVEWVNADSVDDTTHSGDDCAKASSVDGQMTPPRRRTRREISDRQRFRVLVRDGFRCRSCGASPLVQIGIELHVDHILPWSKGGETVDDNLETKCKQCNLGKGNAFDA